ncbi:helix-turn-helix domain-containing protein [Glutamicibacter sp. X7]
MSKNRVIVHQIRDAGLTVTEAAQRHKLSRQRIYQLLKAYDTGGDEALEPRSRRPHSNSRATRYLFDSPQQEDHGGCRPTSLGMVSCPCLINDPGGVATEAGRAVR